MARRKLSNKMMNSIDAAMSQNRTNDYFDEASDNVDLLLKRLKGQGYDSEVEELRKYSPGLLWIRALQISDADVCNGGFSQYYHNSSSRFAEPCIEGLYEIGLKTIGDIFAKALIIAIQSNDFRHTLSPEFKSKYLSNLRIGPNETWTSLENQYYSSAIPWRVVAGEFYASNPSAFELKFPLPEQAGLHVPVTAIFDTYPVESVSTFDVKPEFRIGTEESKYYGSQSFVTISERDVKCPLGVFPIRKIRESGDGYRLLLDGDFKDYTCYLSILPRRPSAFAQLILKSSENSERKYKISLPVKGDREIYLEELCGTFDLEWRLKINPISHQTEEELPVGEFKFGLDSIQLPDRILEIRSIKERAFFWTIDFDKSNSDWNGTLRVSRKSDSNIEVDLSVVNETEGYRFIFRVPKRRS